MPMNYCSRCLERNWSFQKKENWIIATCNNCQNEVVFAAKADSRPQKMDEGTPCRKCGTALKWNSSKLKAKRLRNAWHYCKWLKCEKCRTVYYSDDFKVLRGDSCDCERPRLEIPYFG